MTVVANATSSELLKHTALFPLEANATTFAPMRNATAMTVVTNVTTTEFPSSQSTPSSTNNDIFNAILTVLLAFVIITGLIGNTMVIVTIRGKRSMWTPCNFFLMNIAIADLLVAIVLTPLRTAELFNGWPLGEFLCQFVAPLQDVIVCVSVVLHTLIAFERYRGIVTPFKPKLSFRKAKIAMATICCACYLLIGLPLALVLKEVERKGNKYCVAEFPSLTFRQVFEVHLVATFMFFPLVIQTSTYIKIVTAIRKEDKLTQTISRSGTVEQRRNQIRKKARLVRMLIILVVVFQVCFIPRGIYMLVNEFTSVNFKNEYQESLFVASIVTIVLNYLKHVLNPFILFAMSTDFRKNCFLSRDFCHKKPLDFVSSIKHSVSRESKKDQKELQMLSDNSPGPKERTSIETDV